MALSENLKSYYHVDQPQTPVPGIPAETETMVSIFDCEVDGSTVLTGVFHGDIHDGNARASDYGMIVIQRMTAMGHAKSNIMEVKKLTNLDARLLKAMRQSARMKISLCIVCKDDPMKTEVLRALNV